MEIFASEISEAQGEPFISVKEGSLVALNSNYLCLSWERCVEIHSLDLSADPPSISYQKTHLVLSEIESLCLSQKSDFLALLTDESVSVISLRNLKETAHLPRIENPDLIKWHPLYGDVLFILYDDILTVHSFKDKASFIPDRYAKTSIAFYDISIDFEYEIAFITESGTVGLFKLSNTSESEIGRVENPKSIAYIDTDNVSILEYDTVFIFNRKEGKINAIPNVQSMYIDIYSEMYLLFDGQLRMSLVNKRTLCNHSNGCSNYSLPEPFLAAYIKSYNLGQMLVFGVLENNIYLFIIDNPSEVQNPSSLDLSGDFFTPQKYSVGSFNGDDNAKCTAKKAEQEASDVFTMKIEEVYKRFDIFSDKNVSQMVNKAVQSSINQKTTEEKLLKTSIQSYLAPALKKEISGTLGSMLEQSLSDKFGRIVENLRGNLIANLESNAEEEAKGYSLNLHLKGCVDNIAELADRFKNLASGKEDTDTREDSRKNPLAEEINNYLRAEEYENAIRKVINHRSYLFIVLSHINPSPLVASNRVSERTFAELLDVLVDSACRDSSFPEIYDWIQILANFLPLSPENSQRIVQKLIRGQPENPEVMKIIQLLSSKMS